MGLLVEGIVVLAIVAVIGLILTRLKKKAAGQSAPNVTQQPYISPKQLAEDMRMTQTTSIADAAQILDDLGGANAGYRHYCELVGTSMSEGGVEAPYSKKQVAYYDLRCYRVENEQGVDKETLVAQEKSIEPFWFKDDSGDQRVYVDLQSFGTNCILVNATNRIEGPDSDFAKAMAGAAHGATSSPGVQARYDRGFHAGLPNRFNTYYRAPGPGGPGGPGGHPGGGGRPPGGNRGRSGMSSGVPSDLNVFFGGGIPTGSAGGFGGPQIRGGGSNDAMEALMGIGLGALVAGMAVDSSQSQAAPKATFRGYRIVEDVVPLGSPIYALGEIYRNGGDLFIGRSVSESYASSYFATKPEAEVINSLK